MRQLSSENNEKNQKIIGSIKKNILLFTKFKCRLLNFREILIQFNYIMKNVNPEKNGDYWNSHKCISHI